MSIWDAVEEGDVEEVINYLNGGGDADAKDQNGRTPLLLLLELEHGDKLASIVAQPLIQKKADVNARDNENNPALILAIKKNYPELAKLLIDAGADINAKDSSGKTPLHWCAIKGPQVTGALLVKKGAGLNAQDDMGNTPLHEASDNNDDASDVLLAEYFGEFLLKKGADKTILNNSGSPPPTPGCGPDADLEKL